MPARALLAVALLAASAAADDPKDSPPRIAGTYDAAGTGAGGKRYTATVKIEKQGDVYAVEYVVSEREKYAGIGLLTGRVLSVAWLNQRAVGVLVYTVEKDGTLSGRWTQLGDPQGQVFREKLARQES